MPFDLVRRTLVGVLMLTLAAPAWTMHVCQCARQAQGTPAAAAQTAQKSPEQPLRPCCAKRLAAAAQSKLPKSTQPTLSSRCCCGDVRWNHTVAKVSPVRPHDAPSELAIDLGTIDATIAPAVVPAAVESPGGFVRAGPSVSAMVLLCRRQV